MRRVKIYCFLYKMNPVNVVKSIVGGFWFLSRAFFFPLPARTLSGAGSGPCRRRGSTSRRRPSPSGWTASSTRPGWRSVGLTAQCFCLLFINQWELLFAYHWPMGAFVYFSLTNGSFCLFIIDQWEHLLTLQWPKSFCWHCNDHWELFCWLIIDQ